MAFTLASFVPLSSMANASAPKVFCYSTTDIIGVVLASGYFTDQINLLTIGDTITVYSEPNTYDLLVTSVTTAVTTKMKSGKYTAVADYSFAVDGGATTGLGVYIPDNARVVYACYEVGTACTAAGDATIALSILAANDLTSAAALSTNVWQAADYLECIPKAETESTSIKMTSTKEVTITIATGPLTAGTIRIYIDYIIGL